MTVTAVVTQYFDVYCESSNMPWFAHIWVLVVNAVAVTIAMYLLIQFYVQLRHDLAQHSPFMKVLAIKLVIFFSFWQTFVISVLTSSTFHVLEANDYLAFPDLYVGVPSLLICVEMAIFAVMHIFAYPHKPYVTGHLGKYPSPSSGMDDIGPKQGGPFGLMALVDALNPWDMVKGFGRGIRWVFVGRKRRQLDESYKYNPNNDNGVVALEQTRGLDTTYRPGGARNLPIAEQFTRSKFGMPEYEEENAGLISHAQANPEMARNIPSPNTSPYKPARMRYDLTGQDISAGGSRYDEPTYPFATHSSVHPALREPALHPALRHNSDYHTPSGGESYPLAQVEDDVVFDPNKPQEIPGRVNSKRVRVVPSTEMLAERKVKSQHGELNLI